MAFSIDAVAYGDRHVDASFKAEVEEDYGDDDKRVIVLLTLPNFLVAAAKARPSQHMVTIEGIDGFFSIQRKRLAKGGAYQLTLRPFEPESADAG